MATLKELQNKRKELQTTNPNATMLDAKNAIAPAISNAPIAGQAPAITNPVGQTPTAPTAPVSVHDNPTYQSNTTEQYNQGVLARNKAKVAGEIQSGERPQVGQQIAPIMETGKQKKQLYDPSGYILPDGSVNPSMLGPNETNQPNQPTQPVTSTESTTTTPTTNVGQTQTGADIINQATNDIKNGTIRSFDSIPGNIEYKSGNKGAVVSPPTPRQIAEQKKLTQYAGMSSQQFLDQMKTGQIPSAISSQLAQTNPEFQKAQQEHSLYVKNKTRNDTFQSVYNGLTGKESAPQTDPLTDITNKFMKLMGADAENASYVEAFKSSLSNNEAVRTKTKELNAKQAEINEKIKARDDLLKQYKLTYKDTPLAILVSMAAQDAQPINEEIATLQSERDLLKSDLTYETELAKGEYDAMVKDMEAKTGIRNTILGNLMNAQFGLATKQMEAQMANQIAQQAFNDPMKAIPAMIDEYKKLGIPFERSTQEIVADFQTSGQDLASYLTDLQGAIQSKPEYQRYKQLQAGQMTDMEKMMASQSFELGKMGMEQDFQMKLAQAKQTTNNKWTKLDDGLYTNENGEILTADELKNAKLLGNSYITKGIGEEGGECGFYASRATGMNSTPGGNSKEARTKAFSETTPQVGGLAFFGGAGYDPTYGHISIVTQINEDGTITVKESNYNNDKRVTERTVPASSVTGYYNNTPLAGGFTSAGTQTGGQYSDEQINNLAYLVELQEKNPSEASKQMKEMGYKAQDMANYKAGNMPLTEKQKNSSIEVMDAIKQLADPTKYEWNDAVGMWRPAFGGSDAASATMAIDNLVAKLTLPNLGVLKGPMSDKDIAFIKDASSKLSRSQSDASFERNLIDAYNLSARRAGLPEIKNLSDIGKPTQTTQPTAPVEVQDSEIDAFLNSR